MRESRLLVAGDEYYATLAAVRGLRAAGYEPWLATTADGSLAARSHTVGGTRRIPHPEHGAEAFLAAMRTAATELGVVAALAGTEPSLAALAGQDIGVPTGVPGPTLVAGATDKERLDATATAAGLPFPESVRVSAPTQEAPDVPFPAIVKPARSTVSDGDRTVDLPPAQRVGDKAELLAALAGLPPGEYLVQQALSGDLGALAGVAWHGEIVCMSQQVASRIYPPGAGASAFAKTVALDDALREAAQQLLRELDWSGIWELQFIATAAGPQLIDFNPRFYGSLALAIGAGLNLPAIWADLLLGREPRIGRYRAGVHYRAEVRDARLLLDALRNQDARQALTILRPHRHTVHAVFSRRDPRPMLSLAARIRRT